MKNIRMEEMNWLDIGEAVQKGFTTVVIGIGSTEQHGPHLPTHTDTIIADFLANRIALKLGNALQAQTIRIGCSDHHLSFPGTISLKNETLKAIIYDYVRSLSKHSFKTIIFIPTHGGNFKPTEEAIEESQSKYPELKIIGYTDAWEFVRIEWQIATEFGINNEDAGAHAGEVETSQILAIAKNQVRKERFKSGYVGPLGEDTSKIVFEKGISALSEIGVIGDPTHANIKRGRIYLEKLIDSLVEDIKELLLE
ncbi:MAG: creatininase family protein [Promethearchaeota archaeon]|nr:MAG: creatininase family protein [Candidatus Lokiarchaeota archaeon]